MKLSKRLTLVITCLALTAGGKVWAGPATDSLATCLGDNTSGKERKMLVRWVFLSISSHPDLRPLSAATPAMSTSSSKETANLFTQLLTERCADKAAAAINADGKLAIEGAFGHLGKIAMMEMMGHPQVQQNLADLDKYTDKRKFEALVKKTKP